MNPYYQDDAVTIYHGDCRRMLPAIEADAVVTDPPYGIGADKRQAQRAGRRHGSAAVASTDYGASDWDASPPSSADLAALLSIGSQHVLWGGNYFTLPPASGWLVWDKETGDNGYADFEMAWTDLPMASRLKRYRWMGMLKERPEQRYHPTQKPLQVMTWALSFIKPGVVLDPYMGSGTTLVAAKGLGMRAIGIEGDERYCEIAAKRMAQEVLDFGGAA